MPTARCRAYNAKIENPSRVEHVFAEQKDRMDLFIRTIGITWATTKIDLANRVFVPAPYRASGRTDLR